MNQRQRYIEDALTAYQIAGQYRALGMRTGFIEYAELSKLFVTLAWRYERYADELKVTEQAPIIREIIQEEKDMHPISRLVKVFLILLLALSISAASAQESTEVPTLEATLAPTAEVTPDPVPEQPPTQPAIDWAAVMPYLTQIVIAGITGFVVLAGAAIVIAGRGAPPWVRALLKGTIDSGFEEAEKIVDKTPEPWDNELLLDLKRKVDAIFEQMNEPVNGASGSPPHDPQPGIFG